MPVKPAIKSGSKPSQKNNNNNNKPPEDKKEDLAEKDNNNKDLAEKANKEPNKKENKTHNCTGRSIAENLQMVQNGKLKVADIIKDVQETVVNSIKKIFTNPKDCAGMVIDNIDLTAIPGGIIDKIGEGISGAIDKVSGSFKGLSNEWDKIKKTPVPGSPLDIVKPFRIGYLMLIIKLQNIASKIVFGKDAKEINVNSDTLAKDINLNTAKYHEIVNHPDFQKIFKEWSTGTTDNILKVLDQWQPNIDRTTGKIDNIITKASEHLGTSAGNALVNFLNNLIAAIPVAGAAANVVSTAGTLANNIVETCDDVIKDTTSAVLPVVNAAKDASDWAKCQALYFQQKIKPVTDIVENKMNAEAKKTEPNKTGGGGNQFHHHPRRNTKRIKENIKHTTKRIQKLLSRHFTRNNKNNNYNKQNDTFNREKTLKKSYLRFVRR
jgi:hypothetical protein